MSETSDNPRARWLRVIAIVWVGFISAFVIIDHVALSRLEVPSVGGPTVAEWTHVQTRISALEGALANSRNEPAQIDSKIGEAVRPLESRVNSFEDALANLATRPEVAALGARIAEAEARASRARATAHADARAADEKGGRDSPTSPPIIALGVEWRGGERFLAVMRRDGRRLSEARLIRVGENEGDWRLDAIEPDAAVFVRGAQRERLHLP
jgi:hypothetical protein